MLLLQLQFGPHSEEWCPTSLCFLSCAWSRTSHSAPQKLLCDPQHPSPPQCSAQEPFPMWTTLLITSPQILPILEDKTCGNFIKPSSSFSMHSDILDLLTTDKFIIASFCLQCLITCNLAFFLLFHLLFRKTIKHFCVGGASPQRLICWEFVEVEIHHISFMFTLTKYSLGWAPWRHFCQIFFFFFEWWMVE